MININDLIEDEPTLERIIKIVQALWSGKLTIVQNSYKIIVCTTRTKDELYFLGDMNYTIEELRNKYDIFEIANLIHEAITNLPDDEYDYFCDLLEF